MNKKEAKVIISEYKPHPGFFNLSKKPDRLDEIEYAKVLNMQNYLAEQNKHSEELKKNDPQQWENLKEMAARLQGIIFGYWGDSIYE